MTVEAQKIRIGIAGLGSIGTRLAECLDERRIPGFILGAVSGHNPKKTASFIDNLVNRIPDVPLEDLPKHSDIIIECAPAHLLPAIVGPALDHGKKVVILSVGALLSHPELIEQAKNGHGQIIVPTGALIGLDAVSAAAEGEISSVKMISRKPPLGLQNAPFLIKNRISLDNLSGPLKIYEGTARDAAIGFPANLNVVVALSLAGIGPDQTKIEVWADPNISRNTHRIEVQSDSASFSMMIENIPSDNPKTGRITVQSVQALLRKITAPVRVGT